MPCLVLLVWASDLSSQSPPVVFVSRNLVSGGNYFYPQSGLLPGMGPFSRFRVVGGKMLARESSGQVRVLVDSTVNFNGINLVDVSDPCVHWNGLRIIFSAVEHRDSSWRIYEINADGSGFRKVTFTNRTISLSQFGSAAFKFQKYDDIDPCYLPDGRICFSSTRYPSLSETGSRTTNLYIINSDLSNLHRITTERNGAEEPSIDPLSGKIVFSRWWLNIDMPSRQTTNGITRDTAFAFSRDIANIWQAGSIRPDGEGLKLYSGAPESRIGLHTYKPHILPDGRLLSVFVPHTPMVYTSGSTGIRWFLPDLDRQHYVCGVNQDNMTLYVQNPPSTGTMQPPYATDPVLLPDGRILFSYATQVENQDYALYSINLNGSGLQLFFDVPGKLELNPDIIISKPVPPVITDLVTELSNELPPTIDPNTFYKNGGFRFDCLNMFTNGAVDEPMTDAPPITKLARMRFYLNFQRMDTLGRDTSILFHEETVDYAGGIHFDNAPADVPMFEQVVDSAGKVIAGAKMQVAHVTGMNYGRPGIGTKCVGCHAGHTKLPVPQNISTGQFFNTSTSASVTQSSFKYINDSLQYPGKRVVDRKSRNDTLTVNWIASGSQNEYVELNWEVPIDVRNLVLYNVRPNILNNTTIQVGDCEVFLFYGSTQVAHVPSTGPLSVNGTKINIPNDPKVNRIRVIVRGFTGKVNGDSVAALGEVETIARISYYEIIGIKQISSVPGRFMLYQNYPNPFNPVTKVRFQVSKMSEVRLVVYNVLGREVKVLVNEQLQPGAYEVYFEGTNLASGIYFYRLEAESLQGKESYFETRKMIILK